MRQRENTKAMETKTTQVDPPPGYVRRLEPLRGFWLVRHAGSWQSKSTQHTHA